MFVTTDLPGKTDSAVIRHEERHASQYQHLGLMFLPLYATAAAGSWGVTGSFACGNPFEIGANLADGNYTHECETAVPPLEVLASAGELFRERGLLPGGVL
jgi:hypothetical protein